MLITQCNGMNGAARIITPSMFRLAPHKHKQKCHIQFAWIVPHFVPRLGNRPTLFKYYFTFYLRSSRQRRRLPSTRPVRSPRRTWRCSVRPGSRSSATWPCCWERSMTCLKADEVRFTSDLCAFWWVVTVEQSADAWGARSLSEREKQKWIQAKCAA